MPRPRRLRCVFAVLLGWALLVGTFAAGSASATPGSSASAMPASPASAMPASATPVPVAGPGHDAATAEPHPAAFASAAGSPGPACAPGSPDRDGVPSLPARSGPDQAQAPPAGSPPAVQGRPREAPVRVLTHGPGQSAPSPLELSVMRV
ncbi:hypothetical protein ABZY44_09620 [Streptomyces sp. NPDC006544]|uniref:hypothetical protein n=1 Tax=Streptomyces sp. NPDC006544 TaxID=3154583 RepID=UPI0033B8314D